MHKHKIKIVYLSLVLVFVFSGFVASTATAAWYVQGTKLAKGSRFGLAVTLQVHEPPVLNIPSLGVRVICTGGTNQVFSAKKPFIEGEASGGAEGLNFEGCSEIAPSTCAVESEIPTEPVVISVETGTAPLDRLRFAPASGKRLASINFNGTCAIAGEQAINGQIVLDSSTGQTESASQPLEPLGTVENNSLELAKDKAYLFGGKWLVRFALSLHFSFHIP